jgi:hypothetical protein
LNRTDFYNCQICVPRICACPQATKRVFIHVLISRPIKGYKSVCIWVPLIFTIFICSIKEKLNLTILSFLFLDLNLI